MKICNGCKIEKELIHFYINNQYKGGYNSRCKDCMKLQRDKQKQETPNYNNEYYKKNKEKCLSNARNYYENNKDKVKKQHDNKKDKINEYDRNRRRNNIQTRLANNLRCRLWLAIKQNWKSGSAINDLGCTLEELKFYLEKQFIEGMSWDNHGIKQGQWSIDHIIPLSKVDLTNREEFLKVNNYKNLRPMWHIDNIKKYNKF